MTIDEAIKMLKQAKKEGYKAAVFAWWFADMFDRADDDQWRADTEHVEEQMDWSATHDAIQDLLNETKTPLMATKQSGQKNRVVDQLIEIQERVDNLLADLLPPCPECCPPQHPGSPGEIVDHGRGEISMCEHCWGRGYMYPDDEEDDDKPNKD